MAARRLECLFDRLCCEREDERSLTKRNAMRFSNGTLQNRLLCYGWRFGEANFKEVSRSCQYDLRGHKELFDRLPSLAWELVHS